MPNPFYATVIKDFVKSDKKILISEIWVRKFSELTFNMRLTAHVYKGKCMSKNIIMHKESWQCNKVFIN